MTRMIDQMTALLEASFPGAEITITDDSAKHAGHAGASAGGESHFTVVVVSDQFKGMSRVARHRAVYAPLKPLFETGLHALAIEARVVGER